MQALAVARRSHDGFGKLESKPLKKKNLKPLEGSRAELAPNKVWVKTNEAQTRSV